MHSISISLLILILKTQVHLYVPFYFYSSPGEILVLDKGPAKVTAQY